MVKCLPGMYKARGSLLKYSGGRGGGRERKEKNKPVEKQVASSRMLRAAVHMHLCLPSATAQYVPFV